MSIVITAATGRVGRTVIADLLAAGVPASGITAVARDAQKAAGLVAKGLRLHIADYERPETFKGLFRSGDRVLLTPGLDLGRRADQHAAVIGEATAAGVAQLAYLGMFDTPNSDALLSNDHRKTEQLIFDSGLPYTLLRNNWYSEEYVGDHADLPGVLERGAIVTNIAAGARIASAPRRDYAAAAAVVLHNDGHLHKAYELSGDTAWTLEELAEELSRQTGKQIVHTSITPAEHKGLLVGAGVPDAVAEILVDMQSAIGRGALSGTPGDLSRLIGRPTTPIAESLTAALASTAS